MKDQDTAELRKIIWLDSNTGSGWQFPESQKYGALKVCTVGWLVAESEESVTVSGSMIFGDDYQVCDTMTIPKVCIVSDKTLNKR